MAGTASETGWADASPARLATRERLERRFGDVQTDLRAATRTCAARVSKRVPLPVEPELVDRYRSQGYGGALTHRPDFNAGLPLSQAVLKEREATDVPESEDEVPLVTGWNVAGGMSTWTEKMSKWYGEALAQGGRDAEAKKAFTFSKRMPLVGHVITAAGVGNDIRNGESAGRSIALAGAGIAGTAAAVGVLALVGVSAPVLVVAAVGVGGAVVTTKLAEKYVVDTERFTKVTEAFDDGAAKVASKMSGGARLVWKAIF